MHLKDSQDPLIHLAWFASRIQRRRSTRDSTNKQLLCWKIALDFYSSAERSTTKDRTALILGLAGTLEEELRRKKDAAAKKHRDELPLSDACSNSRRTSRTKCGRMSSGRRSRHRGGSGWRRRSFVLRCWRPTAKRGISEFEHESTDDNASEARHDGPGREKETM